MAMKCTILRTKHLLNYVWSIWRKLLNTPLLKEILETWISEETLYPAMLEQTCVGIWSSYCTSMWTDAESR